MFHYIIEGGVCFLTLCDRGYPKKLAFQYLEVGGGGRTAAALCRAIAAAAAACLLTAATGAAACGRARALGAAAHAPGAAGPAGAGRAACLAGKPLARSGLSGSTPGPHPPPRPCQGPTPLPAAPQELTSEFGRLYGQQVDAITRPYAFIKFGERGGCPARQRGSAAVAPAPTPARPRPCCSRADAWGPRRRGWRDAAGRAAHAVPAPGTVPRRHVTPAAGEALGAPARSVSPPAPPPLPPCPPPPPLPDLPPPLPTPPPHPTPAARHVHPEDPEAVHGHTHAAQPGQAERRPGGDPRHHDQEHRRGAGAGGQAGGWVAGPHWLSCPRRAPPSSRATAARAHVRRGTRCPHAPTPPHPPFPPFPVLQAWRSCPAR
jgi:hypothetical protein